MPFGTGGGYLTAAAQQEPSGLGSQCEFDFWLVWSLRVRALAPVCIVVLRHFVGA